MHSVKLSHVVTSMKHWSVLKGHTFFYPVIRNFIWIRLFRIISIPSKTVFSSVKPHDFDGMLGTGLPVSMYTTKTPLDKCRFNIAQLKELLTFSVKDRYQLNYFICINDFNAQTITSLKLNLFYFLLYCCQNLERKITCLGFFFCYQTDSEVPNTSITRPVSWHLHITITYNLPHLRLWYIDVVTVIT